MSEISCPLCSVKFERASVEAHIAESHSDPLAKTAKGESECAFLRDFCSRLEDNDESHITEAAVSLPAMSVLEDLGVKAEDFERVEITTETGASLTPSEAKRVMEAIEAYVGFRIDRAAFLVNFVDWGIRNGFTEELADAGGFSIVSHNTVAAKEKYCKVATLHDIINESFNEAGTGRSFTFRRFGRYLAKSIPTIVERNEKLRKYYTEGSPMSNRYGVAPAQFLAVTSIFEYIKPYGKWSIAERSAWSAHNRNVIKPSNQANELYEPTDLRPAPSRAFRMIEEGKDDFSRRNSTPSYGKGETIFNKMFNDASKPKLDRSGLGYSEE